MKDGINPDSLSRLSAMVSARLGLHFPPHRYADLERGVRVAAHDLGFPSIELCVESLLSSPLSARQVDALAQHLTVGETYFFREKKTFEALENAVLPALIEARRQGEKCLRLWSAGCCTGEEPYSLAILLSRLLPDIAGWRITILATDINSRFLQKAASGVYSNWSFRATPSDVKERYFQPTSDNRWEIALHIKRMVTFAPLNLATDSFPSSLNNTGGMDMILCRNVLIYLDGEKTAKIMARFSDALVNEGWFITSPSESSHGFASRLQPVTFPGATFFRKTPPPVKVERVERTPLLALPQPKSPRAMPKPLPRTPANAMVSAPKAPLPSAVPLRDAQSLYEQARSYANSGQLAQALEWCERAIAADRLHAGYHYLRATILQEQNAPEAAVASLKRALYLDPNFVLAQYALGNLARREGRAAEATRHFENALSLLRTRSPDEILPESDGLTAARLAEMISMAMPRTSA